jgi:hypothetical protein
LLTRSPLQELGWRAVLPRGALPAGAASPAATSESYDALRLALGVAEGVGAALEEGAPVADADAPLLVPKNKIVRPRGRCLQTAL